MEIPFQVPADLPERTLTLRGTIIPASGGEPGMTNSRFNSEEPVPTPESRWWASVSPSATASNVKPFSPLAPDALSPGFSIYEYLTNCQLSDEMRYILDCRAAKTFPGSLLPRPRLLLNRWTEDDLTQDFQSSLEAEAGKRSQKSRSSETTPQAGGGSANRNYSGGPFFRFSFFCQRLRM